MDALTCDQAADEQQHPIVLPVHPLQLGLAVGIRELGVVVGGLDQHFAQVDAIQVVAQSLAHGQGQVRCLAPLNPLQRLPQRLDVLLATRRL